MNSISIITARSARLSYPLVDYCMIMLLTARGSILNNHHWYRSHCPLVLWFHIHLSFTPLPVFHWYTFNHVPIIFWWILNALVSFMNFHSIRRNHSAGLQLLHDWLVGQLCVCQCVLLISPRPCPLVRGKSAKKVNARQHTTQWCNANNLLVNAS